MKTVLLLAVFLVLSSATTYEINETNFSDYLGCPFDQLFQCQVHQDRDWFIMFYAPWCGFCKKSKPQFIDFASQYAKSLQNTTRGGFHMGLVNCDQNKKLCETFHVHGYPAFQYFPGTHLNSHFYIGAPTMGGFKAVLNYKGAMTFGKRPLGYTFMDRVNLEIESWIYSAKKNKPVAISVCVVLLLIVVGIVALKRKKRPVEKQKQAENKKQE